MADFTEKIRPKIICLTPVKNEAWILNKFLQSASLWADHIIIADQNSTDGSRQIAQRFPKVIFVENKSEVFDELIRQRLLLNEARKISAPRLLIALDADEFLTPNFIYSPEWDIILTAKAGTVMDFQWINISPDLKNYWLHKKNSPLAFMDDGTEHAGKKIHNQRISSPPNAHRIKLQDIKVLHLQYADWPRMESKHRWYQCWERINNPKRSAVDIYRQYHHMYGIKNSEIRPIPEEWIKDYRKLGIDILDIPKHESYWWDAEVLKYLNEYGSITFRKEDIWDIDWVSRAKLSGYSNFDNFKDPRNVFEKMVHRCLKKTQKYSRTIFIRAAGAALKKLGW